MLGADTNGVDVRRRRRARRAPARQGGDGARRSSTPRPADGRAARRCPPYAVGRASPRLRADPRRAARRRRASTASSTSAWLRRRCSTGPATSCTSAATPAWRTAWASRTATPIAPPTRSWPCRGPLDRRRRPLVPGRRRRRRDRAGPQARVARYAWVDHYAPLRAGLRAMARRLRAADERAVVVRRRQLARRPRGRLPRRARLVRQERQPAAARRRQLVRARLRRHDGRATGRRRAGGRRLRVVPALPRRLPDRAPSSPPVSSTPAAAWPGCCRRRGRSRSSPAGRARRPHLRLRRLPGGVPADGAPRPAPPSGRSTRDRRPWVDVLDLLAADDRDAARPPRPLVHRRPRPALAAAQRPGRARQHGRRPSDPGGRGDARSLPPGATTRSLRRARPLGAAPGRLARCPSTRRCAGPGVKHLLVTNDFPPKIGGIQSLLWERWRRLPPDRFAVLTSPYAGSAEFDSAQAFRIERTPRAGAAAPPVDGAAHRRPGPRGRRRARRARPGAAARPRRPVAAAAVRRRAARRRGHRARPAARARKQALGNVLRRARHVVSAGGYPAGEAERAAGRRCRSRSCRPASTSSASGRSTAARARRGPAAVRPAGRRRADRVDLPARAAQGLRRRHRGRRAAGAEPTRPRAGDRRRRARRAPAARLAADRRRRCASSGGCPTTTCPTLYGCADVFAMVCRSGGAGSSRRGSASCSSRRRRAACPRSPATRAAPPRPSTTASPGIVVRHPDDPHEVAAAFAALLDDDALRASMATASRARAVAEFSYDVLAERLGSSLGVW